MYLKRTAIDQGEKAVANYKKQEKNLLNEIAELRHVLARLSQERKSVFTELAGHLITKVDREQVERVCQELGSPRLQGVLNHAEKKREANKVRIARIDKDEEYAHRGRLLCPHRGPYTVNLEKSKVALENARMELANYDFKAFQWLYGKSYHKREPAKGFKRFMRSVVLLETREKRALAQVHEKLGGQDFSQIAQDYEDIHSRWLEAGTDVETWTAKVQYILKLMAEKEKLEYSIQAFHEQTLEALRDALAHKLESIDLTRFHETIRPAGRHSVAQCMAIEKKIQYLSDMIQWLEREAQDRKNRIQSISRVLPKWRRKPYSMMYRDKTKWLVSVPEMKRAGLEKRLEWVRTMSHNIIAFRDYPAYSVLLREMGAALLAYDVFAMAAGVRMPYEGFSRQLIEELNLYRDTYRMEKADYSSYHRIVAEYGPVNEYDWEVWDDEGFYDDEDVAEAMAHDMDAEPFEDQS